MDLYIGGRKTKVLENEKKKCFFPFENISSNFHFGGPRGEMFHKRSFTFSNSPIFLPKGISSWVILMLKTSDITERIFFSHKSGYFLTQRTNSL